MLEDFQRNAKVWSKIKIPTNVKNVQDITNALPPQMLKQLGGMGAVQSLIKHLG
jgi:signal recognition particle subunit SRP54